MILFILGFIFGFGCFIAGLHYSHIKIENNIEYPSYLRAIFIARYLSISFFLLGIIKLFLIN